MAHDLILISHPLILSTILNGLSTLFTVCVVLLDFLKIIFIASHLELKAPGKAGLKFD